jgi:hypothetical protein
MRFAYGSTRWVVIFDSVVIKVARFRPLRALSRALHWHRKGKTAQELRKFHSHPLMAALLYLGGGIRANMIEARISRDFPDLPLARTLFSIGVLNIQQRAHIDEWLHIKDVPLLEIAVQYPDNPDWWVLTHWGRIENRLVLLDYGNPEFEWVFHRHFPRSAHAVRA